MDIEDAHNLGGSLELWSTWGSIGPWMRGVIVLEVGAFLDDDSNLELGMCLLLRNHLCGPNYVL